MLGLTFKPNTDDLREAPSLVNIGLLLSQGAHIYAYDPVGIENCRKTFPEGEGDHGLVIYVDDPQRALDQANVCFIFTE